MNTKTNETRERTERIQKEIIRQKQATFVLLILLLVGSVVTHLILKFNLIDKTISIASELLEDRVEKGHKISGEL